MPDPVVIGAILLISGFLAGALNAMAGGGSFITFPALVYVGLPPVAANATSTVAMFPGYLGGVYGFRRDLTPAGRLSVVWVFLISLAGGLVGALLLLVTPDEVFRGVVPWLLLTATLAFAAGDRLALWLHQRSVDAVAPTVVGLLAVTTYGGYFNGGVGIMLLALFCLVGMRSLNAMNALKNLASAALTAISVTAFALAGIVRWPEAALMMVATTAGGYAGALIARRLPRSWLKAGVVAIGLVMTFLFMWN